MDSFGRVRADALRERVVTFAGFGFDGFVANDGAEDGATAG